MHSCQFMQSDRGYSEAKRLLKHHFGDKYRIATAYIDKALNWPSIRVEDAEALKALTVFLNGCLNAMDSVEYMEEMDHPANVRAILSKLPYKMKEKWRFKACDLQEGGNRRARFKDIVLFLDKQARILSHPVFGNLKEQQLATTKPSHTGVPATSVMSNKQSRSGFVTSVSPAPQVALTKHTDTVPSKSCM